MQIDEHDIASFGLNRAEEFEIKLYKDVIGAKPGSDIPEVEELLKTNYRYERFAPVIVKQLSKREAYLTGGELRYQKTNVVQIFDFSDNSLTMGPAM